ncbi:MAG: NAD(P)H-dependent oxidoreductase [Culicoidibacterales bacterium]
MEKILIINGSPRAKKSNSKQYGELLASYAQLESETVVITKRNHAEICQKITEYEHVVFVFPLYADSIPATLLQFLIVWEQHLTAQTSRPYFHAIVNCGFIEAMQNDVCIEMLQFFCQKNKLEMGSVLSIGSGEAILGTPFKVFVQWKIRQFARSLTQHRFKKYEITMPLTKKMYIKASTQYWINYGKRNGVTQAEMATMTIE